MTNGVEGLSTEELFAQGYAQMRKLKNLAATRRGREKALELTTDLFLTVDAISRHIGSISFTQRPVAVEDEEDDAVDGGHDVDDLTALDDVDELRRRVGELQKSRLDYFRVFLQYFTEGCKHEADVTRKVLACVRRVSPGMLAKFGLSQADVSRKLGEKRATVSAREKRVVEATLRAAGARGVLGNGARGASTSAACARAARGNTNRRKNRITTETTISTNL
jgi:hypothetical protein